MIIPSIDLQSQQAVQLIGGEKKVLDAGDPIPIARQFSLAGEIAVIDLDAAMGDGSNRAIIKKLVRSAPCRVGGGIRSLDVAKDWLNAGAQKIIIGTAARRDLLEQLPRERTIVALDCRYGDVVVEGWRKGTGRKVEECMQELRDVTGGFLVTFVEREGRMAGFDMDTVRRLRETAGNARLTIAGGVTTPSEIRELDKLGVDAQVGMALYTGRLKLADAVVAPMQPTNSDALWPTVIVDESGKALGLAWSNLESVRSALDRQAGVYHSRKRGLWLKGESSGNIQELLRIDLDCDRDALRFMVKQTGDGFCHLGTRTCWGEDAGLHRLERRLSALKESAPPESYTSRLFGDLELLKSKIREEAVELVNASDCEHTIEEAADLIFFTLVRVLDAGGSLEDIENVLNRRALRVTRRPGDAKSESETDNV